MMYSFQNTILSLETKKYIFQVDITSILTSGSAALISNAFDITHISVHNPTKVIDSIGQYVEKDDFVSFVKENIKVDVNE